jgi:hypothetical protein
VLCQTWKLGFHAMQVTGTAGQASSGTPNFNLDTALEAKLFPILISLVMEVPHTQGVNFQIIPTNLLNKRRGIRDH